jgi:hypothetical protein
MNNCWMTNNGDKRSRSSKSGLALACNRGLKKIFLRRDKPDFGISCLA